MTGLFAYLLFLGAIGVAGPFWAWLRIRRQRSRLIVQTLASIVSQNLPLVAALRAAAGSERGAVRHAYERAAQRLELGADLSTALRWAMPSCPGEVASAIAAGERGGTLPSVLQALAADARRAAYEPDRSQRPVWYLLMMCGIVPMFVGFYCTVIAPKLQEIFVDFGIELPAITRSLLAISGVGGDAAGLVLLVPAACALLAVQIALGRHFVVRVPARFQIGFVAWDTLIWYVPLVRTAASRAALARQLPILYGALRAGQDLPAAARQASLVAANFHARRRLTRWATAIERGQDPRGSARALGFPAPVLRALGAACAGGDLPGQFAYLASFYQSIQQHWERVLADAAAPLLVIGWGVVLGYVVVATMLPMVRLLQALLASMY